MWLVLLLYLLFASTFTIGKAALVYITPALFIGIRMVCSGLLLIGFQYWFRKDRWRFEWEDAVSFFNIALFLIYISFVSEFWALQYVSASKACLLFNMSPFATALLAYIFFNSRLTARQWLGLGIGFFGFIPVLLSQTSTEASGWHFAFLSSAELLLIVAVTSSCYGWILMRHLIVQRNYSPIMINGISMLIGGFLSLITSFFIETSPRIHIIKNSPMFSPQTYTFGLIALYMGGLILIANVICFNLYGVLLRRYSPTFISFAGFTTPIFAAFFDFIFLKERVSVSFYVTLGFVFIGLALFYRDELEN